MLRQAKLLAAAGAFEYALQLGLPILLVRLLPPDDFAAYRFVWLVVATSLTLTALGMSQSLYYFLPRRDAAEGRRIVLQSMGVSASAGAAAAGVLALLVWLLPHSPSWQLLPQNRIAVYLTVVLMCGSVLVDAVAAAQSRIPLQAGLNATLAVLRVAAIFVGALLGSVEATCWALAAFAALKFTLQLVYVQRRFDARAKPWSWPGLREHLAFALPFGIAGTLYSIRAQSEQWVAASLLPALEFTCISIASSITPLVMLVRRSIGSSTLARLNTLHERGDVAAMVQLNSRGNLLAALAMAPLIATIFAVADPLVTIVYTARYQDAAIVMRMLCLGLLGYCIEFATLITPFRVGPQLMRADGIMLPLAVAASAAGAVKYGVAGAVLGSVVCVYLGAAYGGWLARRVTGWPVGRLQSWRAVMKVVASGVIAAAGGALTVALAAGAGWHAAWQLPAGSAVCLGLYALAMRLLRQPLWLTEEAGDR